MSLSIEGSSRSRNSVTINAVIGLHEISFKRQLVSLWEVREE